MPQGPPPVREITIPDTAQRVTTKRGLQQAMVGLDPKMRSVFDAILERLEVLDGIRGGPLDGAATLRDLSELDTRVAALEETQILLDARITVLEP